MSLVNFTETLMLRRLAFLRSVFALVRWKSELEIETKKRSLGRRDFMLELMKAHPESFQSEQDFQNMLYVYASRF